MDTPLVEQTDPEIAAFWLRFFRRIIAALQVGGGLCGLYFSVFTTPSSVSHGILFLAFALFGASVGGGVLLALNKPLGVTISLVVQALQVPQIAAAGFLYTFVCGMCLVVGPTDKFDFGVSFGVSFLWYFPARLNLAFGPPADLAQAGLITGVNLVAALAIICLLYVWSAHNQAKIEEAQRS